MRDSDHALILSIDDRWSKVKQHRLYFNCLMQLETALARVAATSVAAVTTIHCYSERELSSRVVESIPKCNTGGRSVTHRDLQSFKDLYLADPEYRVNNKFTTK